MFKCEVCQRTFKNKLGLTSHSKVCKPIEVISEVELIQTIPEVDSKFSSAVAEVIDNMNNIDTELQRRLDRLKYDIRNMYDAETRYRLECEFYDLGGTREFLNK